MKRLTLGVDLGGTKVEVALVDEDGRILDSHRMPTPREMDPTQAIAAIGACVKECLKRNKAAGLGIGVAGQVDAARGSVRFAPNLKWHDVPLADELQKLLGLPVTVVNDVRAATFAEWVHGAAQSASGMVCIFVGTGVGGGVISRGQLLEGCGNAAGELGHMTVVAGGRRCRCPNLGCLEAYTGGWAIAERAQEAVELDRALGQTLLDYAASAGKITAATVARAYYEGDPLSRRLVEETGRYLAAGAVGIVNAFNPGVLVLGGGVIEGIPDLVNLVQAEVFKRALPAATACLRIVKAGLGKNAGVIGAAILARGIAKKEIG